MNSIRTRLFLILLAATGVLWLSAVMWIQHSTRAEVEHVLDRRLQESARMVGSLIARQGGISADMASSIEAAPALGESGTHIFSHQLICQVWGFDGRLKSESAGSPQTRLGGEASGFSETVINQDGVAQVWRVYTHVDPDLGIRVMVGDARAMREGLVRGVIMGLLAPALLILPLTALLIWWALGQGLHPLEALARRLKSRPATDLSPLADLHAPVEIRPLLRAMNGLLARVSGQRDREQSFTAFAAHELKTPLAGIKTQAQIAAMAQEADTRTHALAQIRRGVDRTDRMVRQLLDMTAADAGICAGDSARAPCRVLAEVMQDLQPLAARHEVELVAHRPSGMAPVPCSTLLGTALKNLIENAIHASPRGGRVDVVLERDWGGIRFSVHDRGPGIPADERERITERFYRSIRPGDPDGSGLGLAIVRTAIGRLGGRLDLRPREGGGEEAIIHLPTDPEPAHQDASH